MALAVVLALLGLMVAVAVVSYTTTGEGNGRGRGLVARVARYIPLQSVKIVIVVWQILTQVCTSVEQRGQTRRIVSSFESTGTNQVLGQSVQQVSSFDPRRLATRAGKLCCTRSGRSVWDNSTTLAPIPLAMMEYRGYHNAMSLTICERAGLLPAAQFTALAFVTYPDVYQTFLDGLNVFNFDISWVLSAGCIVDIDFHDRLLMSTIGPIVAVMFLGCTYAVAVRIHRGSTETLQNVRHKHVSLVLLLTFVVYSSVSSVLFSTFACDQLDDGKDYLRSDYRIECDSPKHRSFKVYAGFMIVVYTVGIPAFYAGLLFKDRDVLRQEQKDPGSASRVSSTSDLWKPYKPSVFYYEVIECFRRILLAGVVVFIYPNSAAQIAITLMVAFAFVFVSEGLAPYASRWDHWISRTGHAVVVASMYVALLLKVDVSNERSSSQKVFEAVLIAVHIVMVLVVVVETVVMGLALRAEHGEDPLPRLRSSGKITSREKEGEEEGPHWEEHNPFSGHMQETKNDKA